jgi:hypothetical protein
VFVALTAGLVLGLGPTSAAIGDTPITWVQVGTGITEGVSGLTPAPSGWVIARDNKSAGQDRIALLSTDDQVTDLVWPGTAPSDLESIDAVPNQPDHYVTCTSGGACYSILIDATSMQVLDTFPLPAGGTQNETFAMTTAADGSTLAIWADRGSATTPATLYAATLDVDTGAFGQVTSAQVTVPYPTTGLRPISDATIVGDRIVITSSADNGNDGPFNSAVYDIGTVGLSGTDATLDLHAPISLGQFPGHKIEGIACVGAHDPGLLGTDDENLGGYVTAADVCAPASSQPPSGGSVSFVGASHSGSGSQRSKSAQIPASAQSGDTVLMFFTHATSAPWTGPNGVSGWQQLGTLAGANQLTSTTWVKTLTSADLGATVHFDSTTYNKAMLTLAVYAGVDTTTAPLTAHTAENSTSLTHTTPTLAAAPGDQIVSYWVDKSSSTTDWTGPGNATTRDTASGTGGGHYSSLLADQGPADTDPAGGITATTNGTARATTWTITLHPVGP